MVWGSVGALGEVWGFGSELGCGGRCERSVGGGEGKCVRVWGKMWGSVGVGVAGLEVSIGNRYIVYFFVTKCKNSLLVFSLSIGAFPYFFAW